MKIPRLNHNNTPAALLVWLKEELNSRGIDGAIYNRYILSVLQDEEEEIIGVKREKGNNCCCQLESTFKTHHQCTAKENTKQTSGKWLPKRARTTHIGGRNALAHQCGQCNYCNEMGYNNINSNEGKKLAVIEILKGASEQEYGIESFVDELCDKLGSLKNRTSSLNMSDMDEHEESESNEGHSGSPLEQAKKYFAAFPELGCSSSSTEFNDGMSQVRKYKEREKEVVEARKEWDGRKIARVSEEKNENDDENDCGDSSTQQTTTPTNIPPTYISESTTHSSANKLDHLNVFHDKKTSLDEEAKGNSKCLNGEKKEMMVTEEMLDIENNMTLTVSSEPVSGLVNAYDLQIDSQSDALQTLVDKFNSNIASIWTQQSHECNENMIVMNNSNDNSNAKNTTQYNIWSFDSSFSSPQSSTNSSPKLNVDLIKEIWKKNVNEAAAMSVMDNANANANVSLNEIWEPLSMKDCPSYQDALELKRVKKQLRNTLLNHQKNSLFVEFSPKHERNKKDQKSLKALLSAACIRSKDLLAYDDLSGEDLLVSSRTHFQPIKQEYNEHSDDGSVVDGDFEVATLTVCSSKCPNNVANSEEKEQALPVDREVRPVSTSFVELASFMGPFNDDCPVSDIAQQEIEYPGKLVLSVKQLENCEDKATSTSEDEAEANSLAAIEENEFEPEYQDLCNMINEVLKDGLNEDRGEKVNTRYSLLDWCDEDKDWSQNKTSGKRREHRLSWSCYWDTFDVSSGECFVPEGDYHGEMKAPVEGMYRENCCYDTNTNDCAAEFNSMAENYYDEMNPGNSEYSEWYPDFYDESHQLESSSFIDATHNAGVDELNREEYWNLELNNEHSESSAHFSPFKIDMKHRNAEVCQVFRKPCSFFLEGNCKRSDCKFSHDPGNIVCRFWKEGFCYKHESCPFRHGYDINVGHTRRVNMTDYDHPLPSNPSYTIESESDFPSLALCPHESESSAHFESDESHYAESDTNISQYDPSGKHTSLPLAVFVKKKARKRKDRNLQ